MRRLLLIAVLAITSCATPTTTYVSNKEAGVFFSVPQSWFEVSPRALDQQEFSQIGSVEDQQRYDLVSWQIAYAPQRLRAAAVLATAAQDFPVAYARVRGLSDGERNSVSLNTLRDLVFPVTEGSSAISVNSDQEVSQPGGAGVDLRYDITLDSGSQSLRQVALLSADRKTVYLFVIRCSTTCFKSNASEIDQIAQSFTVRGTRD